MANSATPQVANTVGEILRMVTPFLVTAIGVLIIRIFSRSDEDFKRIDKEFKCVDVTIEKLRDDSKADNKVIHDRITIVEKELQKLQGEHKIMCDIDFHERRKTPRDESNTR